jgi:DNA replication and repair protein RecF
VRFEQLRLENLRNIATLELELGPGLNLFLGANGAGKTSILEGAYLLSHAQSFRTGLVDTLIRRGASQLSVTARLQRTAGAGIRLGLGRDSDGWHARLNGSAVSVGAMLAECAVVCFEPGSHALISGASSERRRFLDWGVFHVEHDFLARSRTYSRVLRQRNLALKQAASDAELDAWDAELSSAAAPIAHQREVYFRRFSADLAAVLDLFLPELGVSTLELSRGWPADQALAEALLQSRSRDRLRGHTTRGPHRADWSLRFGGAPLREHLSRGQEKLCALASVLAQARAHADSVGEWPIIALDDLASELDTAHQELVVKLLCAANAQVLISGIEQPLALHHIQASPRMFHVEHGQVRALL